MVDGDKDYAAYSIDGYRLNLDTHGRLHILTLITTQNPTTNWHPGDDAVPKRPNHRAQSTCWPCKR